jgi:hypothetical protein
MPSTTEKQKRFFGAVMGAKKGQKGVSGAAKKAAKEMTKKQIKKYLKKEGRESFLNYFERWMLTEKKDRCYYAVKARYKVWPSAYASGALVKCRKGKAFKKKK